MKRILLLLTIASMSFGQWAYDWTTTPMTAKILADIWGQSIVAEDDLLVSGSLTVTGATALNGGLSADLDYNGYYGLNNQTTTNMQSEGTALWFADAQYVTITSTAFDTDACAFYFEVKLESITQAKQIILGNSATGGNFKNIYIGSGGTLEIESDTNADIVVGTLNALDTEWHSYLVICDSKTVSIYQDKIAMVIASGNPLTDDITFDTIGDVTTGKGLLGTITNVKGFNTALTASQVKSLSASTPYKWIGASQTELVTNGTFDANVNDWTETGSATIAYEATTPANSLELDITGVGGGFDSDANVFTIGKYYDLTFELTAGTFSGDICVVCGASDIIEIITVATGTFNIKFIAPSTGALKFARTTTVTGTIFFDNISSFQAGVVADYPSYAISDATWHDVSGNANDGAVTGASVQHYKGIHSDGTDAYVDNEFHVADSLIVEGGAKIDGDLRAEDSLTVVGGSSFESTISVTGYVLPTTSYHAYGGFQDSAITIAVTQNAWAQITNASGDLWGSTEADGLTISGDTLTIAHTADYSGCLSLTLSGGVGDDFLMRIYNVTQTGVSGFNIGITTTGNANFANIALPLYFEATAGDEYVIQVTNTGNNDDPIIRSAVFNLVYVHE